MPSLALRLLRKRMREAEDAEASRKRRLLSVAAAVGAYVALVLLTYAEATVCIRHKYMKAHLPRAVDSSWTTLVRTGDDMAYLEYTALTVGAFDLLHCSFQPVFEAWCIKNSPRGRKRSMGSYDVLGLVLAYMHSSMTQKRQRGGQQGRSAGGDSASGQRLRPWCQFVCTLVINLA